MAIIWIETEDSQKKQKKNKKQGDKKNSFGNSDIYNASFDKFREVFREKMPFKTGLAKKR